MENAAKALLMAGGILIALLILGAIVLLFANLQDYQNKTDISTKQAQIAQFNNQFEPFNKKELTLMELKSVYNKIKSNNKKYPEYSIATNIETVYSNINVPFNKIEEEHKQNKLFKCTLIEHNNSDGRISKMNFAEI